MTANPRGRAAIASFKLRFFDAHVRIGLVSGEPGVDLRGDEAEAAFAAAAPMIAWLLAREPGARLRTLSLDLATGRVLVTIDAGDGARPRALRVDAPASQELVDAAADVVHHLTARAVEKLARRR